jgi:hypothetical protein
MLGNNLRSAHVARTSLVSLMSPPLRPGPVLLDLATTHHDRVWMEKDFTRSFWDELAEPRLDLLILDFVDERFDPLVGATPAGPGYKLCVSEFDQIATELETFGYRRLPRFSAEVTPLMLCYSNHRSGDAQRLLTVENNENSSLDSLP